MRVLIADGYATFGEHKLSLKEFGYWVDEHLKQVKDTVALEKQGAHLIADDFPAGDLEEFIRHVCKWGGPRGPQAANKVLEGNDLPQVCDRFREAWRVLEELPNSGWRALCAMNQLRGLEQPSFASKHLRFLRPDVCSVLDQQHISGDLGYSYNARGYRLYCEDCLAIARALQDLRVSNPMERPDGAWFASDVDMALYAWLSR
jgi:hypothetical protein